MYPYHKMQAYLWKWSGSNKNQQHEELQRKFGGETLRDVTQTAKMTNALGLCMHMIY